MATTAIKTRVVLRNDISENWMNVNPVLLKGEIGIDLDVNRIKIGDGTTAWNDLKFADNMVFHNLDDAKQYVLFNSGAYIGQILSIVDENTNNITVYSIQDKSGNLKPVGTASSGDNITIIKDEKDIFRLKGFDTAEIGSQLIKGADGTLSWIVPSTETVEGLQTTISTLQKDVNGINNVLFPIEEGSKPLLSRIETLENRINDVDIPIIKTSEDDNKVSITEDGTMEVNNINVNKLVQTDGEQMILNGGDSNI